MVVERMKAAAGGDCGEGMHRSWVRRKSLAGSHLAVSCPGR